MDKKICFIARELYSIIRGSLDRRDVWWKLDLYTCMTESLCCSPETVTTLLIGHTPRQNVFKKTLSAFNVFSNLLLQGLISLLYHTTGICINLKNV